MAPSSASPPDNAAQLGAAAAIAAPPTTPAHPGSIDIRNLYKRFGDKEVIRDVSISVKPGEVVAIIGPSGAGKTSVLRCVNLLEQPTSGRIEVAGHVVSDNGQHLTGRGLTALRRDVGMVFQQFNVFPHLTMLRNVSLAQEHVLGRTRAEADERSMELLTRVGLAGRAHAHPGQCSGGEQQRVAIARALALGPAVMLFDEPTSALDPEVGVEVLNVMRELVADHGVTMLIVTHEIHFAEDVSDRVVVMADGAVIDEGPSKEVLRHPSSARTRNFLKAILERQ
jgi:polar amino acid transport system ATP-binding protein